MNKTLEQLLTESKAIASAASTGPWKSMGQAIYTSDYRPREIGRTSKAGDVADAAFIAYARTAVPAIIEALELAIEQRNAAVASYRLSKGSTHDDVEQVYIPRLDQALAAILTKGTTWSNDKQTKEQNGTS